MCTLLDRTFCINNTCFTFDKDLTSLYKTLGYNLFPTWLIDKITRKYLKRFFLKDDKSQSAEEVTMEVRYFKLPFIGKYSDMVKGKVGLLVKRCCKDNIIINLIFNTSKIKDSFSNKDKFTSFDHASQVIYKFVCASCNAGYIGETERHLSVRVKEHFKDKNSHVYKHINASSQCKEACNESCFSILDRANTKHQLRVKEGLYIKWQQPSLNKQLYCYTTQLFV